MILLRPPSRVGTLREHARGHLQHGSVTLGHGGAVAATSPPGLVSNMGIQRVHARSDSVTHGHGGGAAATSPPGLVSDMGTQREHALRGSVTHGHGGAAAATSPPGLVSTMGTQREHALRGSVTGGGAAAATDTSFWSTYRVQPMPPQACQKMHNLVRSGDNDNGCELMDKEYTIKDKIPNVQKVQELFHSIFKPNELEFDDTKDLLSAFFWVTLYPQLNLNVLGTTHNYKRKHIDTKAILGALLDDPRGYRVLRTAFNDATHFQMLTFITQLPGLFFKSTVHGEYGENLYDITAVKELYTLKPKHNPSTSTRGSRPSTARTSAPANFAPRPQRNTAAVAPAADATTPRTPAEASAGDSVA
eukprot:2557555-Rhodomonas_salina.1